MRVLVISASLGMKTTKSIAKQEGHAVDFVFYNDDNFPNRNASFTPRMNSKILKMLGWMINPGYDFYLWIDNTFSITRNDTIQWFISKIGNSDALFFKHPSRSSIMSEAQFMHHKVAAGDKYLTGRIKGEPILAQAAKYCSKETYEDDLLIAACAFFYRPTKHMTSILREWYFETCIGSVRDQLSLPYVLQKNNCDFKLIPDNVFGLKYLR